jgi:gas vesicle protein
VGTLVGGIVAFVAGLGLAAATVVGVVQSQESAGDNPVSTSDVSYGSNK